MEIVGKRIIIRPLELKDVFYMRNWGYHDNPLLSDYNFPIMTDEEIKRWYRIKTGTFFNRYYGVLNKNHRLIGYLGIKDIKLLRKMSTLGIVFDPNYVEKGYGTETLTEFLNYYFRQMKMKTMILEVAEFNYRAYRLYTNIGFKSDGYYLDEFHDPKLDLNSQYYKEAKSSFVIVDKKIYNYIHRMRLNKRDFMETNLETEI